jgi:hypothetical protein
VVTAGQVQNGNTSTTTKLSVTVIDINNNRPQFGAATYLATVKENMPRGVPLEVTPAINVTDIDQVIIVVVVVVVIVEIVVIIVVIVFIIITNLQIYWL